MGLETVLLIFLAGHSGLMLFLAFGSRVQSISEAAEWRGCSTTPRGRNGSGGGDGSGAKGFCHCSAAAACSGSLRGSQRQSSLRHMLNRASALTQYPECCQIKSLGSVGTKNIIGTKEGRGGEIQKVWRDLPEAGARDRRLGNANTTIFNTSSYIEPELILWVIYCAKSIFRHVRFMESYFECLQQLDKQAKMCDNFEKIQLAKGATSFGATYSHLLGYHLNFPSIGMLQLALAATWGGYSSDKLRQHLWSSLLFNTRFYETQLELSTHNLTFSQSHFGHLEALNSATNYRLPQDLHGSPILKKLFTRQLCLPSRKNMTVKNTAVSPKFPNSTAKREAGVFVNHDDEV
ncbi:hypothetical protein B0H10DRAFT_1952187 [Mycena sp. CBHHK59/15]|nr:hypothetical protein B0H10DRAFT_1952187 [Mycena sp. CBHHK59/15]